MPLDETDKRQDIEPEPCDFDERGGTEHDLDRYEGPDMSPTQRLAAEEEDGSALLPLGHPCICVPKEYDVVVLPPPAFHRAHETADAFPLLPPPLSQPTTLPITAVPKRRPLPHHSTPCSIPALNPG